MTVIGITGPMGSGKTTVAKLFAGWGAEVLDADRIAHSVIQKGTWAYRDTIRFFGSEILGKNRSINRKKLGSLAFKNRKSIKKLCRIIHPGVIERIKGVIKSKKRGILVIDAPLLLESQSGKLVDRVIVVKASRRICIKRACKKFGITEKEAKIRMKYKLPLRKALKSADFIIDTSKSYGHTKNRARKVWLKIAKKEE